MSMCTFTVSFSRRLCYRIPEVFLCTPVVSLAKTVYLTPCLVRVTYATLGSLMKPMVDQNLMFSDPVTCRERREKREQEMRERQERREQEERAKREKREADQRRKEEEIKKKEEEKKRKEEERKKAEMEIEQAKEEKALSLLNLLLHFQKLYFLNLLSTVAQEGAGQRAVSEVLP